MNYYEPRQRKDLRWDYTCMNDGKIWPVGYCRAYQEPIDTHIWKSSALEKYRDSQLKHHTNGHETLEEAAACYREYLLDQHLQFGSFAEEQKRCVECNEWTQGFGTVLHGSLITLCTSHQTREIFAKHFGPVVQIISSY